jgi:hypothetical protein
VAVDKTVMIAGNLVDSVVVDMAGNVVVAVLVESMVVGSDSRKDDW